MSEAPIVSGKIRLKDETGKTIKSLQANMKSAFKNIGVAATAFGASVTAGLGLSLKAAADFETQMVEAGKVIGGFDEHREMIEDLAKTMGQKWAVSTADVAKAMGFMGSMGQDALEIQENLNDVIQMGIALDMDLEEAARLVASAQAVFSKEMLSATDVADRLNAVTNETAATTDFLAQALKMGGPAAAATAVSFNELLGILSPLAEAGFQGGMAGRSLNTIFPALADNAKALEGHLRSLKDEGFTVNIEAMEGFKDAAPYEQLLMLSKATENLEGAQKREIATMIGGTQFFKQMITLLDSMKIAEEAVETATNSMGSAQVEAQKTTETLGFKFDQLKQEMMGVAVDVGGQLLPVMVDLLETIKPYIPTFADFAGKIAGSVVPAIAGLLPHIETALNLFTSLPEPIKNTLAAGIGLGGMASMVLGPALIGLSGPLSSLIGGLIGGGGLASAFTSIVTGAGPAIASFLGVSGPVGWAILGLGVAITAFAVAWKNNWFGIRDVTKKAVDSIKSVIGGIAKAAANAIKKLKDLFKWKKKKAGGGETIEPPPTEGGGGGGGLGGGPMGGVGFMDLQRGFDGLLGRDMFFRAHRGEYVSVTPPGQVRGEAAPTIVHLHLEAPLINVEGRADEETMGVAARSVITQVTEIMKTVTVEPTSAAAETKTITTQSLIGPIRRIPKQYTPRRMA